VAGLFYPADAAECAAIAASLVRETADPSASASGPGPAWRGGIVPHAGWVCSGAIAGETIGTIAASRRAAGLNDPDVVIIFGAVHTPLPLEVAVLATHGAWAVPGGTSEVPLELSGRLEAEGSELFGVDDRFHEREHAAEVELPLLQRAWPAAKVLPVEVPLIDQGVAIGQRTERAVERMGLDAVYLASSDLTHDGPADRFVPAGVGEDALNWAKGNDRRLLEVVTALQPERVVPEVRERFNACGGGSIAAMLAACGERGTMEARVLRHTNSYEVLKDVAPHQKPDNAVGYAAVVVG
jgi:AmmeMemoRadiSam system protein B